MLNNILSTESTHQISCETEENCHQNNFLYEEYGKNTLLWARVFEWFSAGREDMEDDEQPGCLVTMRADENAVKIRILLRKDHCLGTRIIAEEMNMDKEMAR